ncbi:hypothetical protein [Flavobacterium sp. KACC 22763]|uniref:hypothetical protein n=1 Tax=Flavobacterium sp. KACC 22763 TaxID=3025668 RepID=UPI0023653302|nr:hypothetical protein [Flavobacterium sp. KACC 22763]WDF65353.1 hypothetical protein PQ463_04135 [Flavobacterium sp. KACC 22763]
MKSSVLGAIKLICVFIFILLFFNCNKKSDSITITVHSIDSKTKLPRLKTFDTIEVRTEGFGFIKKTFKKVAEYTTDSTGSVKIMLDGTEGYNFLLRGPNIYGSAEFSEAFTKEKLKDGQEVNIEVISLDNK